MQMLPTYKELARQHFGPASFSPHSDVCWPVVEPPRNSPVTANRIRQVFLGVLKPRIEGGSSFGERQVQVLDLAELFLDGEESLFASFRVLL